ncbi:hypothetical protein I4U23_022158 [Adineta vaga]|nr:hypothetical protein I4U23_022158 [Adineta vaga]
MDFNDDDHENDIYDVNPIDEKVLSQQFDHLSLIDIDNQPITLKEIDIELNRIPKYLMKQNQSLKQMICHALSTIPVSPTTTATSIESMKNLRKITILIHKIMIIETYHNLWTIN